MYYAAVSRMNFKKPFEPGGPVPETAVYAVVHDGHRATHHVTLRKGETFPACARCGERVRFEQVNSASSIRHTRARKGKAGKSS
jgi:hypothetical protein